MRHRRRPTPPRPLDDDPFHKTTLGLARNLIACTTLRQLTGKQMRGLEDLSIVQELAQFGGKVGDEDLPLDKLRIRLRRLLKSKAGQPRSPRAPEEPVKKNLSLVSDLLGLSEADGEVMLFLLALNHGDGLQELTGIFGGMALSRGARLIAAALHVPLSRVLDVLSPRGRLISAGMVQVQEHDNWNLEDMVTLHPKLMDLMMRPGLNRRRFVDRFLPEAGPGELERSDYEHVDREVTLARSLLDAGLEGHRHGLNILLYGPTGTGKTELARVLAAELGAKLYATGRASRDGSTPVPEERMASLMLGHRLMAEERALLLFDEMEDLFDWRLSGLMGAGARGTAHMSKQWFNQLLETCPVPTIWISNATEGMDPAFLRRFTYAVELEQPGVAQRARVLRRHLGEEGASLAPEAVEELARRHPVSPAQLAGAVRWAACLAEQDAPRLETVERILAPVEKLVLGKEPEVPRRLCTGEYLLDAVNADTDLSLLADRLAGWQPMSSGQGISLCLYGPPGTGKSELVAYLARRVGRELHRHMASDLLSKWVGGTEERIAAAFRRAEQEGALLLLDEADSFLRDRRGADHSWEVTQVNELLQQLERFTGIVACTTNLMEELDAASLRRFVFKIELGYLRPEQVRAMTRSTLVSLGAQDPAPAEGEAARVVALGDLTPGDFAAVARRLRALGEPATVDVLRGGLERELHARRVPCTRVGFGR